MGEEILARSILLIVMAGAGVLILWMASAAADGRLGRNQIAGIRLPSTLVSDRAWLAAHRAARRPTQIAGWCAIIGSIPAALPVPLPLAVVSVLVGAVLMLVFTLRGAQVASRAAQDLPPEA